LFEPFHYTGFAHPLPIRWSLCFQQKFLVLLAMILCLIIWEGATANYYFILKWLHDKVSWHTAWRQ